VIVGSAARAANVTAFGVQYCALRDALNIVLVGPEGGQTRNGFDVDADAIETSIRSFGTDLAGRQDWRLNSPGNASNTILGSDTLQEDPLMGASVGMAGESNSSWSEDCQYQREHYNTRCRKGQELPARLPDTMNASPDRQHDDQQKESNYCCHRSSSAMIAAATLVGIWLA
jgi:hypothetical protein